MSIKEKVFFPNLDGLRFLCFLSVFFFHSFFTNYTSISSDPVYHFIKKFLVHNGNIGVNFFFVLSGFLITFLLMKEKEQNDEIDVVSFWMRRVLRIWPLYFFCVFFGFQVFPILKSYFGQTPNETAHLISYFTFSNNFDLIRNGLPDASILGVLWSIAIEEQFYLVWPILLAILPVKMYKYLFALVIIVSLVFRVFNNNYIMSEFHTLSCIGDMAVGAFGAYIAHNERWKEKIVAFSKLQIVLIYVSFFTLFLFRGEILQSNPVINVFDRLIIAIFALLIILEQNYAKNSLFKLSKFKTISGLGIVSYGLYCLHAVGILITITLTRLFHINNNLWEVLILETAMSLALTILLSKISYNYFEVIFLRKKNEWAFFTKD